MTPTQTKRAIEIMSKHGQDGWKIQWRQELGCEWQSPSEPGWEWISGEYRAVGPRKRVELKRGMEVKHTDGRELLVVQGADFGELIVCNLVHTWSGILDRLTHYRWPNGDDNNPWLPIEGEPEIISMEVVE